MNWPGIFAYAFPPLPLIPYVVHKLTQMSLTLIRIAPTWAQKALFTTLLQLFSSIAKTLYVVFEGLKCYSYLEPPAMAL